jgi:hypothetical protein
MENASSAQLPEKLNAEEYDLVILGGGTGSTTGSIFFTNYFNNVARTEIDSPWANQKKAA